MWSTENVLITIALGLVVAVICVVLARVRWKPIENIEAIKRDFVPHVKQAESFRTTLEGVVRSQERQNALLEAVLRVLAILGQKSERSSDISEIIVKASLRGGE